MRGQDHVTNVRGASGLYMVADAARPVFLGPPLMFLRFAPALAVAALGACVGVPVGLALRTMRRLSA